MDPTITQFTQAVNYSHGSVRDQIVPLMSVDQAGQLSRARIPPLVGRDFSPHRPGPRSQRD